MVTRQFTTTTRRRSPVEYSTIALYRERTVLHHNLCSSIARPGASLRIHLLSTPETFSHSLTLQPVLPFQDQRKGHPPTSAFAAAPITDTQGWIILSHLTFCHHSAVDAAARHSTRTVSCTRSSKHITLYLPSILRPHSYLEHVLDAQPPLYQSALSLPIPACCVGRSLLPNILSVGQKGLSQLLLYTIQTLPTHASSLEQQSLNDGTPISSSPTRNPVTRNVVPSRARRSSRTFHPASRHWPSVQTDFENWLRSQPLELSRRSLLFGCTT